MKKNDKSSSDRSTSLIRAFMPYINRRASRIKAVGMMHDDLVQEGLIGLLDAIDGYDEERGTSFEAFAIRCIDNRIYSALRQAARKKNTPLNDYLSLSDESDKLQISQDIPSPEEIVILQEELNYLLTLIREDLSTFEKKVLALYLEGYSYMAISEMLATSSKSVDNALQRARKKLK